MNNHYNMHSTLERPFMHRYEYQHEDALFTYYYRLYHSYSRIRSKIHFRLKQHSTINYHFLHAIYWFCSSLALGYIDFTWENNLHSKTLLLHYGLSASYTLNALFP